MERQHGFSGSLSEAVGISIIRTEVSGPPQSHHRSLFFLVLFGDALISKNPYVIRVIILTSIFAILAASWTFCPASTGQMNFGHALFFGMGPIARRS